MTLLNHSPGLAGVALFVLLGSGVCAVAQVGEPRGAQAQGDVERPNNSCQENVTSKISVDAGHPWRPPFGVERVGAPAVVHLELTSAQALRREYDLVAYRNDREIERLQLHPERDTLQHSPNQVKRATSYFAAAPLKTLPEAVAVVARCAGSGRTEEITRQKVDWPAIEAAAVARPDRKINPVDLGAILVPHDWLLLGPAQKAVVKIAALSRVRDIPNARLKIGFDGGKPDEIAVSLIRDKRFVKTLTLPPVATAGKRLLHLTLTAGGRELWKQAIPTMVVHRPPPMPAFGSVETTLRYDAPILNTDPNTGKRSFLEYDSAWEEGLDDVVICLPNGGRFVFWRGAGYVPFWAGIDNVGLSYEWAETLAPKDSGATGNLEAIYDRELRHSRVRIVESTASRVHVRWTYQSVARDYEAFGDQATEDFYFYPDGFGTRVLTLSSGLEPDYEISELILITPQSAFPLEVLPRRLVEMLYLDGTKRSLELPYRRTDGAAPTEVLTILEGQKRAPTIYRAYLGTEDPQTAIYFNPNEIPTGLGVWAPMKDRGEIISPAYWGSHWPLARGMETASVLEDIHQTPAHISFMPWLLESEGNRPLPIATSTSQTLDALGHSRQMLTRRWAFLIGQTDASDEVLRGWGESFSVPPSIQVTGARIDVPSYSQERRAIRLVAESPSIEVKLQPAVRTVNPVFEIDRAPAKRVSVTLDGHALPAEHYAWDGATLWVEASIGASGATLGLRFH